MNPRCPQRVLVVSSLASTPLKSYITPGRDETVSAMLVKKLTLKQPTAFDVLSVNILARKEKCFSVLCEQGRRRQERFPECGCVISLGSYSFPCFHSIVRTGSACQKVAE